jgi:hypothetical protein
MPQAQRLVLPLAHLCQKHKDTPVFSCTTDFSKGKSFCTGGCVNLTGFSATYLNTCFHLPAKETAERGSTDYWAAPHPPPTPGHCLGDTQALILLGLPRNFQCSA